MVPQNTSPSYPLDKVQHTHPVVFLGAALLALGFVILCLVFKESALEAFMAVKANLVSQTGWFFLTATNLFLLVCVFLIFTQRGAIRLGGGEATASYSFTAWLAMLFSAGMGIGLVFWSVAEPIFHYGSPSVSDIEASTKAAARMAQTTTFFHWGLHAWGIYALMGLSLAFCAYNRGLPLTIRSTLEPILGKYTDGPLGNCVDILASVATLFGVATSLGFGVQQVNAGLAHVLGIQENHWIQMLLIAVITLLATISVVSGLDRGVRLLSEANMALAGLLMVYVLFAGPTWEQISGLCVNTMDYFRQLPALSVWFGSNSPDKEWQESWTIFYWAWWISWSPFVGMFIARISRGRTLREFTIGVLIVPTGLTFMWLSVFGNAALAQALSGNIEFVQLVNDNQAKSLFALLDLMPLSKIMSLIGLIVIVLFFVTSSDSGSLVIDIITSGGHPDPPIWQRIFWAVTEGVVAAALLLVGGDQALQALQTASVVTGLPFACILVFIAFSFLKQTRSSLN